MKSTHELSYADWCEAWRLKTYGPRPWGRVKGMNNRERWRAAAEAWREAQRLEKATSPAVQRVPLGIAYGPKQDGRRPKQAKRVDVPLIPWIGELHLKGRW